MTYFLIADPDKLIDNARFREMRETLGTLGAARQLRHEQRLNAYEIIDKEIQRAESIEDLAPAIRDLLQLSKSREML